MSWLIRKSNSGAGFVSDSAPLGQLGAAVTAGAGLTTSLADLA